MQRENWSENTLLRVMATGFISYGAIELSLPPLMRTAWGKDICQHCTAITLLCLFHRKCLSLCLFYMVISYMRNITGLFSFAAIELSLSPLLLASFFFYSAASLIGGALLIPRIIFLARFGRVIVPFVGSYAFWNR